jgi:predicted RNA-binding Zn ribbon-like protein
MSEKIPAEGDLELVRRFVNTLEADTGADELATRDELVTWFNANIGPVREVAAADLRTVHTVREALRQLLLANNAHDADVDSAGKTLDAAARRAGLAVRFRGGHAALIPTRSGINGVLGQLLKIVAEAMADGRWSRLKACRADDCQWAFYDTARNSKRAWCSMEVCGNREKARRYRARHAS